MQAAVLKAVIQKMKAGGKFFFRQKPGAVTVRANDHRHVQLARDQQRFVAEALRRTQRIDHGDLGRAAAVAAGKHVKLKAALL